MLRFGRTSVLGRAYSVDEVLPLPVPAGSGGVVDRLGIPAAQRCGCGDLEENLCRASPSPGQSYVEEGERGGGQTCGFKGCGQPLPLPLLL